MIIFYKVTYHRLDIDDYQVYGFQNKEAAKKKFNYLLALSYDSDVPFDKFVLRLGEVEVGPSGYYSDTCLEIS